jgi:hypothetical protein
MTSPLEPPPGYALKPPRRRVLAARALLVLLALVGVVYPALSLVRRLNGWGWVETVLRIAGSLVAGGMVFVGLILVLGTALGLPFPWELRE